MLGRRMAPVIVKIAAIDLSGFIISIAWSEIAIKNAILKLKTEFLKRKQGKVR
jgi:hypothetical protein